MADMRSDVANIKGNASNAGEDFMDKSKAAISDLKKQGGKMMDQASSQLHDGMEYVEDHAEAVKTAVMDYINAKPGTSIAIGLGALYLLHRMTRR